jgi:prepilin-type processing-associated H-X9-DG protein
MHGGKPRSNYLFCDGHINILNWQDTDSLAGAMYGKWSVNPSD